MGLQFNDVAIPNGATIESATIQFLTYSGEGGTTPTNLTIEGAKLANPTLSKTLLLTDASFSTNKVSWNIVEAWISPMSRIDIAKDVFKEVFGDRSISWGFATWSGGSGGNTEVDSSGNNYTKYLVGVHNHDETHQMKLQQKTSYCNSKRLYSADAVHEGGP